MCRQSPGEEPEPGGQGCRQLQKGMIDSSYRGEGCVIQMFVRE